MWNGRKQKDCDRRTHCGFMSCEGEKHPEKRDRSEDYGLYI